MYFSTLHDARPNVRQLTDGEYSLEIDGVGVYLVYTRTGQKTRIMQPAEHDLEFTKVEELSSRELQVFELLGEGHSLNEIAERLKLSVKTVETYRARIKDKFDAANGMQIVRLALKWHMFHRAEEARGECTAGSPAAE